MSRIAKNPIEIPKGVTMGIVDGTLTIKGPKGVLSYVVPSLIDVIQEGEQIRILAKEAKTPLVGTVYARIRNMVQGVTNEFECKLVLVGVGYRAQIQGNQLSLTLGFSHPVVFAVPKGIVVETPTQTDILVKGIDKHLVGQVAANIRKYRSPEPYKGKGIRYADEKITLKETKKK